MNLSGQSKLSKWHHAIVLIKEKYDYSWNLLKWGVKFWSVEEKFVCREDYKETMHDICKFVSDEDVNLDILRKCFLIEVRNYLFIYYTAGEVNFD